MSIETARTKLKQEAASCGGLEKAIASHLDRIMDDELAALVDRPDYTVKEMGGFVMAKARKQLNSNSGYLADEVVYGFATDYYHATREEIKKNGYVHTPSKAPTNTGTNPPKAAKKAGKAEATAVKPPKSIKAQEKKEKAAASKAAKRIGPEGQLSLFDLMGGFGDA